MREGAREEHWSKRKDHPLIRRQDGCFGRRKEVVLSAPWLSPSRLGVRSVEAEDRVDGERSATLTTIAIVLFLLLFLRPEVKEDYHINQGLEDVLPCALMVAAAETCLTSPRIPRISSSLTLGPRRFPIQDLIDACIRKTEINLEPQEQSGYSPHPIRNLQGPRSKLL